MHKDSNLFVAENSAIVICSEEKLNLWKEEIKSSIIIRKESDFDIVTYELLLSGVTLLLTPDTMILLKSEAKKEIEKIKAIIDFDGRIPLDDVRSKKFHILNLSSRMPKAKAPLNFVLFKCIVSDEYFDYTLDDLSSMWTFVTIGYDGSIPVYQDKQEILSRKYFHDLNNNNHDVWRILNEKHAHIMIPLLFPKVILKKIKVKCTRCQYLIGGIMEFAPCCKHPKLRKKKGYLNVKGDCKFYEKKWGREHTNVFVSVT
jgi:hypothetical protein